MNQVQSAAFAGKAHQKEISKLKTKIDIAQEAVKALKPDIEKKPYQGTPLAPETLAEGTKVKLNMTRIYASPDFASSTKWWKEFVQKNTETVFTVERDPRFDTIVKLAEDPQDSEYKFLWYVGDLEVVD